MKNTKKLKFNSFFSGLRLYRDIFAAGPMVSPSNLKHLKLIMSTLGWRIVSLSFLTMRGINRVRSLHNFVIMIYKLYTNHGSTFVVKYLKVSQLAIQKKISGSPFSSLREIEPDLPLPRLTRSGLPSFIK